MKISIITSEINENYLQIQEWAKKLNYQLGFTDLKSFEDINEKLGNGELGDVIIYRNSSLSPKAISRTIALTLMKERHIINLGLIMNPFVAHKIFQQNVLSQDHQFKCIKTYNFKSLSEISEAIQSKSLKYPFIMKPDLGARGERISLINNIEEISIDEEEIKKYIFQNYVSNDGDFRVLVLGGKALGVIKRTAKSGNFVNNISQGGGAEHITDEKLVEKLTTDACRIASRFDLTFCGIDFIQDSQTGEIYFLELNTVPQWAGFQEATGIDVGKEIVEHCSSIYERKNFLTENGTSNLIKKNYDNNIKYLPYLYQFHYASRMFLWTKDNKYRQMLDELKNDFIGDSSEQQKKVVQTTYYDFHFTPRLDRQIRNGDIGLYEKVVHYNDILRRYLFGKTIYNVELGKYIEELISKKDLNFIYTELIKNPEAILSISTDAINYIFYIKFYFESYYYDSISVDLESLFSLVQYYIKENSSLTREKITQLMYILTHCIIGQSEFYNKPITNKKNFGNFILLLENTIEDYFFDLGLDIKLEFLMCCKLLNHKTHIKNLILNQAHQSISYHGNYLEDKIRSSHTKSLADRMTLSEHSSVLYIMATTPYCNENY